VSFGSRDFNHGLLGESARYGGSLRGRFQSHDAVHHGSGSDRRCLFRKAQQLQSSRHLSDDSAARQPVDDRNGDVAVIPATDKSDVSEGVSSRVLRGGCNAGTSGRNSRSAGTLYCHRGGTTLLPQWLRFTRWKRWMRIELVLWAIVLLSGAGTYYAWYVARLRRERPGNSSLGPAANPKRGLSPLTTGRNAGGDELRTDRVGGNSARSLPLCLR
jgi:hypothetical protein